MNTREFLASSKGKFFRVDFVKRTNGEHRRMVARTGVHKGVTGQGMGFNPREKDLMVVYDVEKRGYRCIPLDSVIAAKVNGQEVHFDG